MNEILKNTNEILENTNEILENTNAFLSCRVQVEPMSNSVTGATGNLLTVRGQ